MFIPSGSGAREEVSGSRIGLAGYKLLISGINERVWVHEVFERLEMEVMLARS